MKKNVFSRAIAVLASMTVLGAATMLSASAQGVKVDTVEVEPGTTTVQVPVYVEDVTNCKGCEVTFTAASPEIKSFKATGALVTEGEPATGVYMVFMDGTGWASGDAFTTLTVTLDADAEPGEYPIEVAVTTLDDNDEPVESPEAVAGAIVVKEAETDPAPTEAPTTAATTAAPTTAAATTTTAKKGASPKTGSTGVAVAVAGLVTAGATAVVLKKKH